MNQKCPLLRYRIKHDENKINEFINNTYDFIAGMWLDKTGQPIIKTYVEQRAYTGIGETMITRTRESIDRTERSIVIYGDRNVLGETLVTATREGIDRAERSENYMFQTLTTFTRESIDRSERT